MALHLGTRAVSAMMMFFASAMPCLAQQDWFLSAENNCSGNAAAISAFSALLPSSFPIRLGIGNTVYTTLGVSSVDSILTSGGEKVIDNLRLNQRQATDYKTSMDSIVDNYGVPYFLQVGGGLFTRLLPPVVGKPVGLLYSYLMSLPNAKVAALRNVTMFIAAGGRLERRWKVVRETDKSTFAASSLEYVVALGDEERWFITQGCIYPVNVLVTEFETNEPRTNKIIKPNGPPGVWGVWDIDDSKWDSYVLKYQRQEQEFYYFSEDAVENGVVVGQHTHRISFEGGRWQYKSFFDGPGGQFKNWSSPGIKVR